MNTAPKPSVYYQALIGQYAEQWTLHPYLASRWRTSEPEVKNALIHRSSKQKGHSIFGGKMAGFLFTGSGISVMLEAFDEC